MKPSGGNIEIQRLAPRWHDEYTRFLQEHPGGLLYYSLAYREMLLRLTGCCDEYRIAVEEGRIRGVLPLMSLETGSGHIYNSLPYYGSHGYPLADHPGALSALLSAYHSLVQRSETIASTLIENPFAVASGDVPYTHLDHRISQFTPLPSAPCARTAILSACEPSVRRNVNKAERQRFTVTADAKYLPELRDIHENNMLAIGGRAKQPLFFDIVPEIFVEHEEFDLYVVLDGNRVAAGVLIFYFGRTVEYYTPAIHSEYRSAQPLSAALIVAMTDAAKRGFEFWNWGGTWETQTGVYRFKRKWGAEERRYRYFTQVNDSSLLSYLPQQLVEEFPNFFVVPFSALGRGAA